MRKLIKYFNGGIFMNDKNFERDMEVYEISGLFNGLSQEISMMGFSLSDGDLELLTEKIVRMHSILNLIQGKIDNIKIDKILNDD